MPYLGKDPPDRTAPSNGSPGPSPSFSVTVDGMSDPSHSASINGTSDPSLPTPNINHGISDNDLSEEEEERLNTQPEEVILQGGSKRKGAIIERQDTQPEAAHLSGGLDSHKRKSTSTLGKTSKKKKRPEISDANLAAQVKQVKASAVNINDSLLRHQASATEDRETEVEHVPKKYFTTSILGKKHSVWWEGFRQFVPSKHPTLYSEYVMCESCAKIGNP